MGDDEGQGSLECCSPWGRKELDTTERLKNKAADGGKQWLLARGCVSEEIGVHRGWGFCRDEGLGGVGTRQEEILPLKQGLSLHAFQS